MEQSKNGASERQLALDQFIERLVAELEPLQLRYNEATWRANLTGKPEDEKEAAELDAQVRKIFARREPYEFLRRTEAAGGVPDPLAQRQLELLVRDFRAHQIPVEMIDQMVQIEKWLESQFNNFRAEMDGRRVTDNELRQFLRDSDDSEQRRRAWEATKQVARVVEPELLRLVELRNQAARHVGYDNYYSMMLELDELDEAELFALLERLESGTRSLFERYKKDLDSRLARRFGVATEELRPWHYSDPFFQEAPPAEASVDRYFDGQSLESLTQRYFAAVGFDVRDLLARADLYEKEGKNQHAFCMSVDRAADVRVLCNIRPNEYWMATMLHEFGHAVYDVCVDRSLPYLLRGPAHTMTTEASAMLFGRLSKHPAWLETYAGVPEREARELAQALDRATRDQLLVQARWILVMSHMERAVYRDPRGNLHDLWWDLVERYQLVRRPPGRSAPDWASKVHFSVAPVYYHNYLLGEMTASQLRRHILDRVLGDGVAASRRYVTSREVGEYLKTDLYATGRRYDWRETIRRATGDPLLPDSFIGDLGGAA